MKNIQYLFTCLFVFLFASCKDDENNVIPTVDHFLVAEGKTASGKKVKLWSAEKDLLVAYNKLYVSVQNDDSSYTGDPAVTLTPVMDMGTMKHSSPVEQPVYDASTKLYPAGVVFSMPSGDMGSWTVTAKVDQEEVTFPVNIKSSPANTKYTTTFVGSDGTAYTITLVDPSGPKIGLNDLVVLVNRRESMMSFPAVQGLTLEVTPEMPSMGHGSPNNVNPAFTSGGRYAGKVNFTMTGDWRLHFKVLKGSTVLAQDVALDLLF